MRTASRSLPSFAAPVMVLSASRRSVSSSQAEQATGATDHLWHSRWPSRADELDQIDRIRPTDADKLWAIRTLRAEAAFVHRQLEPLGEAYGSYYIELGLFVARLRDPRSIDALASAADIAPAVRMALVELGDAAVEPVIATLGSPFLRASAAFTLRRLLESGRLSAEKTAKIRRVLAS